MLGSYRKILDLLDRRERRQFHLLVSPVAFMAAFEAVSVGSILPFPMVPDDPATLHSNGLLRFGSPGSTASWLAWGMATRRW